MTDFIRVPSDGSEPEMTDEPADVHIHRDWNHRRYGSKLGIELPAPWDDDGVCKDHFKELPWENTHRAWNDRGEEWEADFEALNWVVEHMNDGGWDVTVALDVAKKFEDEDYVFLPNHRDEDRVDSDDSDDSDENDDDRSGPMSCPDCGGETNAGVPLGNGRTGVGCVDCGGQWSYTEFNDDTDNDENTKPCVACGDPIPNGMFDDCSACTNADDSEPVIEAPAEYVQPDDVYDAIDDLRPGDRVLWGDRKQPCTVARIVTPNDRIGQTLTASVIKHDPSSWGADDSDLEVGDVFLNPISWGGMTGETFAVIHGPRGGFYALARVKHRGDDRVAMFRVVRSYHKTKAGFTGQGAWTFESWFDDTLRVVENGDAPDELDPDGDLPVYDEIKDHRLVSYDRDAESHYVVGTVESAFDDGLVAAHRNAERYAPRLSEIDDDSEPEDIAACSQ